MSITEKHIDNEHIVDIDTSVWHAEVVVTNNANLIRLHHKPSGTDVLRTPATLSALREKPEHYGMPLLFPLGRIAGGTYTWNARTYRFPINDPENNCNLHGLIMQEPWNLEGFKESGNETKLTLSYTHDRTRSTFPGYPHEFKLILRYVFSPEAVHQQTELTNLSNAPMPFGLGFHSAFNVPQNSLMMVPTDSVYYEISPETKVPTGERHPVPAAFDYRNPDGSSPGNHSVGMLTQITPTNNFRGAVIYHPHAKVIYEVDKAYKFWALWNEGGGKGFFCIEPLTCLSNAPNLDLPPSQTGLQTLQSNQLWTGNTRIKVEV